jgi:Holliday junction resolvasome RuvABC endonuclease subunit
MRILGIDSSKHSTGFVFMVDGKIEHQSLLLFEKGSKVGAFLSRLRFTVQKKITEFKPDYVIVEDLNIQFMAAARHMFLYHGVIQEAVWNAHKSEAIYVVNSSWRSKLGIKTPTKDEKIAKAVQVGINKKGKPVFQEWDVKCETILQVNALLGTKFVYEENDIADAAGLCLWGEIALVNGIPEPVEKKKKKRKKKDGTGQTRED